jgi:TPR repeat protein
MKKYIPLMALVLALSDPSLGYTQDSHPETDLWRKAIEQGDKDAQYNLGTSSWNNSKVKDGSKVVHEYVDGKAFMGLYCQGMGFNRSEEFTKWLFREADRGNPKAQYCAGLTYWGSMDKKRWDAVKEHSPNTPCCSEDAVKWFRKAADQGDAVAQAALGLAYEIGHGAPKDENESIKWFRKAAEQGDASAQAALGNHYLYVGGNEADYKEAVKWLRKAADQGNADAQYHLGDVYHKGEGVEKDDKEAENWYRKAADQGNAYAQEALKHDTK